MSELKRVTQLDQVGSKDLTAEEVKVLSNRKMDYARSLAESQVQYDHATETERELSATRKLLHARLAKYQLLEFCRNDNYQKTPRSLAKALAGLPFIGWRRSMARSSDWFVEIGGIGYRTFKIIERMSSDWNDSASFSDHAKKWLEQSNSKNKRALQNLKDNWYFLKQSIDNVQASPPRSKLDRARWIAQDYYQRTLMYTHQQLELKEAFAIESGRQRKIKTLKIGK